MVQLSGWSLAEVRLRAWNLCDDLGVAWAGQAAKQVAEHGWSLEATCAGEGGCENGGQHKQVQKPHRLQPQ